MWAFVMTSEEMADAKEGTAIEAAMTTKKKKMLQLFLLLLDINRESWVIHLDKFLSGNLQNFALNLLNATKSLLSGFQ